jgi:hypothetical protein
MDTLSLTLDVAGGHSLYTLPKSTVTVKLLGFAIQQHRKYTLMSSAGMLPDILARVYRVWLWIQTSILVWLIAILPTLVCLVLR